MVWCKSIIKNAKNKRSKTPHNFIVTANNWKRFNWWRRRNQVIFRPGRNFVILIWDAIGELEKKVCETTWKFLECSREQTSQEVGILYNKCSCRKKCVLICPPLNNMSRKQCFYSNVSWFAMTFIKSDDFSIF